MRANQFITDDHKRLDEVAPLAAMAAGALTITGILTIIGVAWTAYDVYNILDRHDIGAEDLAKDPEEALNRISEEEWFEIGLMALFAAVPGLAKLGGKALGKMLPNSWKTKIANAAKERFQSILKSKPKQLSLPLEKTKVSKKNSKPVDTKNIEKNLQKEIDDFMQKKGYPQVKDAPKVQSSINKQTNKIIDAGKNGKIPNKIKSLDKLPGDTSKLKEALKDVGKMSVDTAIKLTQAYFVGLELRDILLLWKQSGYPDALSSQQAALNMTESIMTTVALIVGPRMLTNWLTRKGAIFLKATRLVNTAVAVKVLTALGAAGIVTYEIHNVPPEAWEEVLKKIG
jgi:hypothetical protein